MSRPPYTLGPVPGPRLGLVVLQADETIEGEMRRLWPAGAELLVTRVPSGAAVTPGTLAAQEARLTDAAALFPEGIAFDAVAYACTSGAAEIGSAAVAAKVRAGTRAAHVTDPLRALVAACGWLGLRRIALLSPYTADVSARLRDRLASAGIATPRFASFEVAEEASVVRIDGPSLAGAARDLAAQGGIDALFLSCTNLRTLDIIAPLEAETGLPVLTSNGVLAWHLSRLSGQPLASGLPGRLLSG